MALLAPPRSLTAPYGIPVNPIFYAHDIKTHDYKDAAKIKTIDIHPVYSWVLTGDEDGNVVVWDYESKTEVAAFAPEVTKEAQRTAIETLEAHAAFAASQNVTIPDAAGPGLGIGPGSDPGATAGSTTESFISSVISGAKRKAVLAKLPEDAKTARAGKIRSVKFADEHVLGLLCGCGTPSGYEEQQREEKQALKDMAADDAAFGFADDLVASIDDALARLSNSHDPAHAIPNPNASHRQVLHAYHNWLIVICEHRVFLYDYSTTAVVDIPFSSLLIEVAGSVLTRNVTRGRPNVMSAALVSPGMIAFGCEDGLIRLWHSDYNAVVQTVKASSSLRPVTHLSTVCPSATSTSGTDMPATSKLVLVSGTSDGYVTAWDVLNGRQISDGGKFGYQQVKLNGELLELSVSPITFQVLAVTGDKTLSTWDVCVRSGAPKIVSSKLVTSSSAAETGLGSRMLSACSLAGHPYFPPTAVVAASKGPHLELGVLGASDKAAETGTIFYDLRTSRSGLPSKCKIYVMAQHPFKPDLVVAGTNIGVFCVQVAPHYSLRAACLPHTPTFTYEAVAETAAESDASAQQETNVVIHVNANGMLIASEVTCTPHPSTARLALLAEAETTESSAATTRPRPTANKLAYQAPVSVSTTEHILQPAATPPAAPPATVGPGSSGNPNALSNLYTFAKGVGLAPGLRGVKLRLSGTGRFLAAIWPDCKCYTIYRLKLPCLGFPGQWSAEVVESGGGVDIAWNTGSETFANVSADGETPTPAVESVDRFVVIEPGIPVAIKKVYGGGMPIGSAPPVKGGKGRDAQAAPALPHFPNTMALKQIKLFADPSTPPGVETVLKQVPLPQEPVAAWSGPVLSLALASDTGSTGGSLLTAMTTANLQFFGWNVFTPPPLSEADMVGLTTKAKEMAVLPRLPVIGSTAATPAPSLQGVVTGAGVQWNATQTAFFVMTPAALIIFAAVAAADTKRSGGSVIEVCRVPVSFASATWTHHCVACIATTGASYLVIPPIVDLQSTKETAQASLNRGATHSSAVVIQIGDITGGNTTFDSALPRPQRTPCIGHLSVLQCMTAEHMLGFYWAGTRSGGFTPGVISLRHSALRALCAATALQQHEGDSTLAYSQACSHAASIASKLSPEAQSDLAYHLNAVGCPSAAMMLPACDAASVISICTRSRNDISTKTFACRWAVVDAMNSVAALVDIVKSISDDELLFLSTSNPFDTALERVESFSSVMPFWPQVAAYMSLASAAFPTFSRSVRDALTLLCERLVAVGCGAEATLVAAVTLPDTSAPHIDNTSVQHVFKILKTGGKHMEFIQRLYESIVG